MWCDVRRKYVPDRCSVCVRLDASAAGTTPVPSAGFIPIEVRVCLCVCVWDRERVCVCECVCGGGREGGGGGGKEWMSLCVRVHGVRVVWVCWGEGWVCARVYVCVGEGAETLGEERTSKWVRWWKTNIVVDEGESAGECVCMCVCVCRSCIWEVKKELIRIMLFNLMQWSITVYDKKPCEIMYLTRWKIADQ